VEPGQLGALEMSYTETTLIYAVDYTFTGPVLPSEGGNKSLSAVTGGKGSNANKKLTSSALPYQ
jgi:hypothetical protein